MRERLAAGSVSRQTPYVFTTETGEPSDPRNALRAIKAAAKSPDLPGVRLDTLRHTAASVMLMHNAHLEVVSEVLGHGYVVITGDIYGHVDPNVSRDAMTLLGAALEG